MWLGKSKSWFVYRGDIVKRATFISHQQEGYDISTIKIFLPDCSNDQILQTIVFVILFVSVYFSFELPENIAMGWGFG